MNWSAGYVGLRWQEHGRERPAVDCWGLVRLVYREQRGVDLPSYAERYASTEEQAEIAGLIAGERATWRLVPLTEAEAFDVLLLREGRWPSHVGVVVKRPMMLHVRSGGTACVERYDGPMWGARVVGCFRWGAGQWT